MHGARKAPFRLRWEYLNHVVFVIGQFDACTLHFIHSLDLLVTTWLGPYIRNACRLYSCFLQFSPLTPDPPVLPASTRNNWHSPACYNLIHWHHKFLTAITCNLLQHGPGLISTKKKYDDDIIPLAIWLDRRRTCVSLWRWAAWHRVTSQIITSWAGVSYSPEIRGAHVT